MRMKLAKKPEYNDWRRVIKFAWIPKRIGDTLIWLEPYVAHQIYDDPDLACLGLGWNTRKIELYEEKQNTKVS
jgi:hypothetical protein